MEIKFLQKDQPNWLAYAGQLPASIGKLLHL